MPVPVFASLRYRLVVGSICQEQVILPSHGCKHLFVNIVHEYFDICLLKGL